MCICSLRRPPYNAHAAIFSSVACHALLYFYILSHKWQNFREKKSYLTQLVFWFYLQLLSETFLILTLDDGLLASSQYPEGPATGHLDTGFSWFPCVYNRMLRWFQSFQVATTCLSCSPPDLNFLVTFFSYLCTCKITTATG